MVGLSGWDKVNHPLPPYTDSVFSSNWLKLRKNARMDILQFGGYRIFPAGVMRPNREGDNKKSELRGAIN